jgi:putative Flp pilus-assembly TadE/G-like protein
MSRPDKPTRSSERGAILVHVAIAMLALIAVNTFVVDYGVMWVARRQAQNAADAGALAGAVAMAFDPEGWTDRSEDGPARLAAYQVARTNEIWGQPPDVNIATDIFFTDQPAGQCRDEDGNARCIRVNVYRNQERGNSLPTVFGLIVGLTGQGVRATATARVAVADGTDCIKPVAIPDKWRDVNDITAPTTPFEAWTQDDTFETHAKKGDSWFPLPNPDVYVAPSETDPGTGFAVATDLGMKLVLAEGQPGVVSAGGFAPVRLPGELGFRDAIKHCNGIPVVIGDSLVAENSDTDVPDSVHKGFKYLIDLDPHAEWDPSTNSVINSCAQDANPCASQSPRIVALPVYDTGQFFNGIVNGQSAPQVTVVNIVGFFVDWEGREDEGPYDGQYVVEGYFTETPGLELGNATITPEASLLSQIQLVR